MIQFFKQIRQRRLENNRFGKYLLYAAGEIVLVVIGIFIAIQLNGLNQKRIDRIAEKKVLGKLINDLDADYQWLSKVDSFYQVSLSEIESVWSLLQKPQLSDGEITKVSTFYGAEIEVFNNQTAAYDEMINSGNLYKLQNDTLLQQIINYYRIGQEEGYKADQDRREFRNLFYGPEYLEFFYPWSFADKNKQLSLSKKLFSNPESEIYKRVLQAVNWSSGLLARGSGRYQKVIELNRKLQASIENEIK